MKNKVAAAMLIIYWIISITLSLTLNLILIYLFGLLTGWFDMGLFDYIGDP